MRAWQGVPVEGVSPTPVPERKRGLRRAKMAAAAAAAAATEQVCELAAAGRGLGKPGGRGDPIEGGDEGGREGWAGAAERGGRAGPQGGSCPQPRCWRRPGWTLGSGSRPAGERSCPSAGVTRIMACGACAWMCLSAARNHADKNNVSWGREAARCQPSRGQLLPGVDRGQDLFLPCPMCRRPRFPRPLWFPGDSDTNIKLTRV